MICILDLSSGTASLPPSYTRGDLPSMQVAVLHYMDPVGSNPVDISCEFC